MGEQLNRTLQTALAAQQEGGDQVAGLRQGLLNLQEGLSHYLYKSLGYTQPPGSDNFYHISQQTRQVVGQLVC